MCRDQPCTVCEDLLRLAMGCIQPSIVEEIVQKHACEREADAMVAPVSDRGAEIIITGSRREVVLDAQRRSKNGGTQGIEHFERFRGTRKHRAASLARHPA